jgi:prepilin-type processing-associated H-X9-DG protein
MLPQLEQSPLYNVFNFSSLVNNGIWNLQNAVNSTGQLTTVNVFICPSDSNRLNMSSNGFPNANPGPNNYAANAGNTGLSLQATTFDQTVGPFPGNTAKCAKMSNIVDGTSNTVAFSEIVKGVGAFANNLDNLYPSATPVPLTVASSGVAQTDYNNCKAGVPRTVSANNGGFPFGACWWWGRSGQNRFTGVMPPNGFSCDYNVNSDSDTDAITAGSRHPGVVNVLLMDGSVRGIKSTVNPITWWAIGSMAGNEVVSADAY